MTDKIAEYMNKYGMLNGVETLLCGVSGGADSVCLLHVLHKLPLTVKAVHFNHMLRGAESDRDEEFVRGLCRRLGVELVCGRGDVAAFAAEKSLGTEEAARILRYDFFEKCIAGDASVRIATAHNADDNAETVIMNLTRGAGLSGMTGIPPVRGSIIRPLLCVSRAEIDRYLAENNISHVEDSTNSDDAYTRNKIRHRVVPVLRTINNSFEQNVYSACELLREDAEYLDRLAAGQLHDGWVDIKGLEYPIASRAVRMLAGRYGIRLSKVHTDAALNLGSGSTAELPGGLRARRSFERLYVEMNTPVRTFTEIRLTFNSRITVEEAGVDIFYGEREKSGKINSLFSILSFKNKEICGNITVRPRREGDRITIAGRGISKTLKKLFIEMKIPAGERELIPVFADDSGVLAVGTPTAALRRAARPGAAAEKGGECVIIISENVRVSNG